MAEEPNKKEIKKRLEDFTWYSKQELYEYFQGMYRVSKEEVDKEIDHALKSFKLRKGKPIDPKELWQKVGGAIEKRLSRRNEPTAVFRINKNIIEEFKKKNEK